MTNYQGVRRLKKLLRRLVPDAGATCGYKRYSGFERFIFLLNGDDLYEVSFFFWQDGSCLVRFEFYDVGSDLFCSKGGLTIDAAHKVDYVSADIVKVQEGDVIDDFF